MYPHPVWEGLKKSTGKLFSWKELNSHQCATPFFNYKLQVEVLFTLKF